MSGERLWEHQEAAIRAAEGKSCFGLFHDVGTGKTCTAVNILRGKYKESGRILRTIIFTPPIILINWKREWLKWSKLRDDDVVVLDGSQAKRIETFTRYAYSREVVGADGLPLRIGKVFITNYESLLMEGLFKAFSDWQPEVVVADEMHKIKSMTSKRTKLLLKLSKGTSFRLGLTGSPVLNSLLDIFPQILFLDQGKSLGTNFFAFRGRYMVDKNAGMPKHKYFPRWEPIHGAEREIRRRISDFTSYVKKSDCLSLPPYIEEDIFVDLAGEARRLYEEMKRDFITFINGKEVVATMALTKLLRLQQIASGFCHDFDGVDHIIEDNPKLSVLEDLLESICLGQKEKCIVWTVWRATYRPIGELCEKLGLKYVYLTGDTKASERQSNVDEFCSGDASVCIANPAAAGVGVNLVEASYSIWYSRSFSLEHEIQAEARNYRGGSERHSKITRYNLISRGTVDELVAKKLRAKEEIGFNILEGIHGKI